MGSVEMELGQKKKDKIRKGRNKTKMSMTYLSKKCNLEIKKYPSDQE